MKAWEIALKSEFGVTRGSQGGEEEAKAFRQDLESVGARAWCYDSALPAADQDAIRGVSEVRAGI